MECLDAIADQAKRNNGVIDKTEMEMAAIRAARMPLYEALSEMGLADLAAELGPEKFDQIIEAVWDGCRASMSLQSARGGVPF